MQIPLVERDASENSSWARLVTAAFGLLLVILIVSAMFSSQTTLYPSQNRQEQSTTEEQIERFWNNVEGGIHRRLGEVL